MSPGHDCPACAGTFRGALRELRRRQERVWRGRALTILQPSASAIAARVKPWENRPRLPPSTVAVGEWIGLHAGAAPWPLAHLIRERWPECPPDHELPYNALIGAWRYGGAYHRKDDRLYTATPLLGRERVGAGVEADPWALGPFCLVVADVVLLPEPIPVPLAPKGERGATHQGWWFLPDAVAARLEAVIP